MKKTKKILFLVLACILLLSTVSFATNTATPPLGDTANGNQEDNKPNESMTILNSDVYMGQKDVVIDNAVNGNVFVAGSNVTIKGEIVGDLFVMADTLIIEDTAVVYSNIFAFVNKFIMKGSAYDIYAYGGTFELANSGYIYRDLKLYGANISLNGIVKKDVYITASNITFPENAKNLIGGNLHYTSNQEITIPEGAILGEVKYTPAIKATPTVEQIVSSYIMKFVCTILYALVVILLATFYAPKFIEKANYTLMKRPFIGTGIGILAIVLIPIFALFLMVIGFLSYIGIALFAIYGLILSITLPIFSMVIAKSIEKKLKTPSKGKFILFSILSAIVLWILQIVPYIGGYISLFIFVLGLGTFLFSFFIRKDVSELGKSVKETEKSKK